MGYLALYRKYRPKNFDEVVGQESIIKILKNQIKYDRIGHAYLFSGIRGTGKTSLAKVFAKAINCPNNQDGNPCNSCEVCKKLDSSGVMDIIEIDGASNRGVDEIREIREKVKYPPVIGRYKVYIIDEVHMLTKEAFNALLKTLEEPPEHIVFILATTEPQKCPTTILSRCQRFEIKPISVNLIASQLKKISQDLNLKISDESLFLVAERGDQSMRDALSLMDQIIDLKDEQGSIEYEEMLSFLGMAGQSQINHLISNIINKDTGAVIIILRELKDSGRESVLIMDQIIKTLRDLLIVKTTGQHKERILKLNQASIEAYDELACSVSLLGLADMTDFLIQEKNKMKYSSLQDVILEIACLRLAMDRDEADILPVSPLQKSKPPKKTDKNAVPKSEAVQVTHRNQGKATAQPDIQVEEKKSHPEQPQIQQEAQDLSPMTGKIFERLCQQIGPAQCMFLKKAHPEFDGKIFSIAFAEEDQSYVSFIDTPQHREEFENILREETGQDIKVTVKVEKEDFSELDIMEKTKRIVNDPSIEISQQ
ncbi:DNA polymerase III subunit gamma/tau [Eubacteriaceae bacterium ES2]|nr:DNA polymerase III subunit gamma/tau [Eubacteriaceae bacterium ES2]